HRRSLDAAHHATGEAADGGSALTKSPGAILDGAKRRARADRLERSATSNALAVDGPEGARPRMGRVTAEAQDGLSTTRRRRRSAVRSVAADGGRSSSGNRRRDL